METKDMFGYEMVDCPARRTAVLRRTVKLGDLPAFFSEALTSVLEAMEVQGTLPSGEPFAYYRTLDVGAVDVEAGFPTLGNFAATSEVKTGELPAGRAVTGVHVGPYDTLDRTYADMSQWAVDHGREPTGEMWEVYLTDPEREPDPNRWRMGIFLRVH